MTNTNNVTATVTHIDAVVIVTRGENGLPRLVTVAAGSALDGGLFNALPTQPVKPVAVEAPKPEPQPKPLPQEKKPEPKPQPTTTADSSSLLEQAKKLKIRGAHLYSPEKLAAKIAEVTGSKPQPQEKKPEPKPEAETPKGSSRFGGGGKPQGGQREMKKEMHKKADSQRCIILNKSDKEMEVWAVKLIRKDGFEGYLVLNPDRNTEGVAPTHIYGAVWIVAKNRIVRWLND